MEVKDKEQRPQADHPVYANSIYPNPNDHPIVSAQGSANSNELNELQADSVLRMAGLRKLPPKSVQVNVVAALLSLDGLISLLMNYGNGPSAIIFDLAYIGLGVTIYLRYEFARIIALAVAGLGLLFSFLGLFSFGLLAGRKTIGEFISIILTIVISFIVLGIFMDEKVKDEFS